MNNQELKKYIVAFSDELYQNNLDSGIKKVKELLELINTYVENTEDRRNAMIVQMKNMMEAMENKDYVLMADILVFEVLEIIDANN